MSGSEERQTDRSGEDSLGRLESAVEALLEDRAAATARASDAERRVSDLERELSQIRKTGANADDLEEAVRRLKDQNATLRRRIAQGRDGVERLLSRIEFLESQK